MNTPETDHTDGTPVTPPAAAIEWRAENNGQPLGLLTFEGPGDADDREFMIARTDGTHYRIQSTDGTFKATGALAEVAAAASARLGHTTAPTLTDPTR